MLSSDDKDKKGNYYMEIPYDTDITINDETLDITEGGETVSTENKIVGEMAEAVRDGKINNITVYFK